jgi:hypothetical protein
MLRIAREFELDQAQRAVALSQHCRFLAIAVFGDKEALISFALTIDCANSGIS